VSAPRIVPAEDELTAPYWAAARRGVVALQRCIDCGLVWHPPLPTCPGGAGHAIEWIDACGRATLYSYTSVRHAAHPAVAAALPYLVALVDLAEGPRLVCTLLDADEDGLVRDQPLLVSAGPTPGGLVLPVARPAGSGAATDPGRPA
jgi:hypothetical protein